VKSVAWAKISRGATALIQSQERVSDLTSLTDKRRQLPQSSDLAPVLERNIEALHQRRKREEEEVSWQGKTALAIASFVGSMTFVYLQWSLWDFG
jgi:uncharacterized membrane protein